MHGTIRIVSSRMNRVGIPTSLHIIGTSPSPRFSLLPVLVRWRHPPGGRLVNPRKQVTVRPGPPILAFFGDASMGENVRSKLLRAGGASQGRRLRQPLWRVQPGRGPRCPLRTALGAAPHNPPPNRGRSPHRAVLGAAADIGHKALCPMSRHKIRAYYD
eukprot:COSAG02_NODE_8816_length_2434_cov_1.382013_1_plen_159_part_00